MRKRAAAYGCLLVIFCILTACAQTPVSSFIPASSAAAPSNISAPPFSYVDPERPPKEAFIPQAPGEILRHGRPAEQEKPLTAVRQGKKLAKFDGLSYSLQSEWLYTNIGSVLYSASDLFFVAGTSLYYSDLSNIYRIMEDVYDIGGSDKDGMYLIVKDESIPDFPPREYDSYSGFPVKSSLVHYHPVTGAILPIATNVQAACVAGPAHEILFFATAQQDDNPYGYRFVIKRAKLPYTKGTSVFTDEFVASHPMAGEEDKEAAWDVALYPHEEGVGALLMYPYPSEYPYERHIWFDGGGQVMADSEQEPVAFGSSVSSLVAYKGGYQRYGEGEYVPCGPYEVKAEREEKESYTRSYLIKQNGKELYWKWNTYMDILPHNGLLYCDQGAERGEAEEYQVSVYDGAYSWPLSFWEKYEEQMFLQDEDLYFVMSGAEGTHRLALYSAAGTKADPTAIEFQFAVENEQGFYLSDYRPSMYAAGPYILFCTYDTMDMAVANMQTNRIVAAGHEGTTLLIPA